MNKALHIGINYEGTPNELNGCINDVNTLILMTKDFIIPSRRLILTDHSVHTPNIKNITQAICWLLCGKCDNTKLYGCHHNFPHKINTTLYFTYSGHGSQVVDRNGDEKDGLDETIYVLNGNITDDFLYKNLIHKIPKVIRLWCVVDACHSQTSMDLRFSLESTSKDTFTITDNNNNICQGIIVMISGCRDNQSSADAWINNSAQGALTYSLYATLKDNPKLQIHELSYHLKKFMEDNYYDQRPVISFGPNLILTATFFEPIKNE